jgi:hypothetical protein
MVTGVVVSLSHPGINVSAFPITCIALASLFQSSKEVIKNWVAALLNDIS